MIPLFAYGTLRDADGQEALFGRAVPASDATLDGWRVVVAESGYFTLVAEPGATVAGRLLELDAAALALADRWEEVPRYRRLRTTARTADGARVACWVYVMPTASRAAAPQGTFAAHDRERVLAAMRAMRASPARGHGALNDRE
jgi:gamma-glutamylcyclotransferase (GGCT)/AIG2-like uncharacterized protein YtfP